ncbi:DUF3558 domain-containing protein [Streptomyces sp. SCL15-4]|uniref:DUF3558 domain-containing protein n=1 Tax=Streptomyces sp. SCL15-4 TaxID=2967221 RepID=UPI002965EA9C|nr:DUF3558 domain-containing protein [Streptomyces sp. SCL15-4]
MQRADQRDDRAQRHQRAKRLRHALVCAAAVPAVLITAGCSSDSGDAKAGSGGESTRQADPGTTKPSASASPTVRPAAYGKLPDACGALAKKTLTDLVPAGAKSARKGGSDEPSSRASCSWNSLDNNGVKGSQFRWLNISLLRFDSDVTRGAADEQAHAYFGRQVQDAQSVDGAKGTKMVPLSGIGAEAAAVRYDLKKKEGLFKQQTVVARVENVVVTLDYNGAGLAGEKTPDADDLTKDAQKALKEVVASVSKANGASGEPDSPASDSPSGPASTSSKPGAKSASRSLSKSPSARASASGPAVRKS